MRDGTHLAMNLYYKESLKNAGPVILIRTVYNKDQVFNWSSAWPELIDRGYTIAVQDIRGRYASEGQYQVARGRREDGVDTLDWILTQPFSNGRVGLGGCSYQGETQVVLEATHHPALVVGQPQSPASGYYRPGRAWQSFSGGAFELAQTAGWFASNGTTESPQFDFSKYLANIDTLPTGTLLKRSGAPSSDYEAWRASDPDGTFFRAMDLVMEDDSVSVPNLFFDTWYDYGARETLMMANQFRHKAQQERVREHQHLIIGPGTHCNFPQDDTELSVGERPMTGAALDYHQIQIDWYEQWLRPGSAAAKDIDKSRPFLTYYVMGANAWRTADAWPLPNTVRQRWYLGSKSSDDSNKDGHLILHPSSETSSTTFLYDPDDPVPSLGGHACCTGSDKEAGGYDQSEIEQRDDVLVFTSAPLQQGMETTGLFNARLFVSSSAVDTDFTVKLVDVYPDGKAYNVQEGIVRMRYRNSLRKPELITPGEVYEVDVDLNATSNYFAAGHRIRVEISSSNFPRFERNLNTGEPNGEGTHFIKATNTVWHGGHTASYLDLPMIPVTHLQDTAR